MDENHQSKTESKTRATKYEESELSEEKEGTSKRKETSKLADSTVAKFFQVWATPLSILLAAATLLWSVYQFNVQQQSMSQQALDQQRQTILDTYLDASTIL